MICDIDIHDLRLIVLATLMIPAFCAGVGFREIFRWLKTFRNAP